jgi:preprotein translocase subunit SecG
MHTNQNEDYFIPIFIFFITTLFLVYVINKVELSKKEETEHFINTIKYKLV